MQLTIISCAIFFLFLAQDLKAQFSKIIPNMWDKISKRDTTKVGIMTYERPDWQAIDVNFLSSYYAQDGNNSPVTGGIGTEQLTDFTQKLIVSVPVNEKLTMLVDGGYDYYSSASTDNIDNIRSSDSKSDVRMHGNLGFNYQLTDAQTFGARLGASTEYDYTSVNFGLNYGWQSADENTAVDMSLQAFIDQWALYFPAELRGTASVPTKQRQSYNASLSISQVLSKKVQAQIQLEATYMNGLLSTPFHRVYFQDADAVRIENLPSTRLKIPIGLRVNTFLSEKVIARWYYRFYWDDWGVQAHTASVELPIKINRFFSVFPFYRFHTQTAADYFQPYQQHQTSSTFYTSDFDLSALQSHSFGLGLSYSPANGIAKIKLPFRKRPTFTVKSIDLKYSRYYRSTGLQSDIISLGFSFSF
ncbi:MAG: DUF3570 domain-containing protein [Saprospiraceae bacterium]